MEAAKKSRSGVRSWATTTSNQLLEACKERPPRKHVVQGKKEELLRRLQSLDEAQEKVEQLVVVEQLEEEVKEAAAYRAKVSEALYFAEEVLEFRF